MSQTDDLDIPPQKATEQADTLMTRATLDAPIDLTPLQDDALDLFAGHLKDLRQNVALLKKQLASFGDCLPALTVEKIEEAVKTLWQEETPETCAVCPSMAVWSDDDDILCARHAHAYAGRCGRCRGMVTVEEAIYEDGLDAPLHPVCSGPNEGDD
jgi:hypothetical protein